MPALGAGGREFESLTRDHHKENAMIACVCRSIYEEDYADDESLRARIMAEDWRCGQCQLRYEFASVAERPKAAVCKTVQPLV